VKLLQELYAERCKAVHSLRTQLEEVRGERERWRERWQQMALRQEAAQQECDRLAYQLTAAGLKPRSFPDADPGLVHG
jgi:hypothetical protein